MSRKNCSSVRGLSARTNSPSGKPALRLFSTRRKSSSEPKYYIVKSAFDWNCMISLLFKFNQRYTFSIEKFRHVENGLYTVVWSVISNRPFFRDFNDSGERNRAVNKLQRIIFGSKRSRQVSSTGMFSVYKSLYVVRLHLGLCSPALPTGLSPMCM